MKKVCVLTGAGISAESGLKTFRDSGGLWEGHNVMEVASPEGWHSNPLRVLEFYNQRRSQLKEVKPNAGHISLIKLEDKYEVVIVTQNVDDLHERAGSTKVLHLHGELNKVRSIFDDTLVYTWTDDLHLGDCCEKGFQLRPHIVWFGETVPKLQEAIMEINTADVVLIVGTSMQVYPAAGLIGYAPNHASIYYIDPKPGITQAFRGLKNLEIIPEKACSGVPKIVEKLYHL